MTNYMKSCSFLHALLLEEMKVVENLFKKSLIKYGENSFIEKTYVVGIHWNCLKETILVCTYNLCY